MQPGGDGLGPKPLAMLVNKWYLARSGFAARVVIVMAGRLSGWGNLQMKIASKFLAAALVAAAPHAASAAITWTDWTQAGANTVIGTVGGVGVTFTGAYGFAYVNPGEFDYWNTPGYNTWDNTNPAPTGSDLIALNQAGTKTITFAAPVQDVYLAIMSWQGQANTSFDKSFTLDGWVRGCGYWGCSLLTNVTANSFTSNGEAHGILKFAGPITSLTFQESNDEYWHGIQVGIGAAGGVPEPSAWALMILGLGAAGTAMRRRTRIRSQLRFA